jgi:hypothetical protein
VRNGPAHVDGSLGTVRIDPLVSRAWKRKWTGCGSRVSPMCIGKAMTGAPVRSTVAQGEGPPCVAPTAVPEQRPRSKLGFDRFQRRADAAIWAKAGAISASRRPRALAEPTHER